MKKRYDEEENIPISYCYVSLLVCIPSIFKDDVKLYAQYYKDMGFDSRFIPIKDDYTLYDAINVKEFCDCGLALKIDGYTDRRFIAERLLKNDNVLLNNFIAVNRINEISFKGTFPYHAFNMIEYDLFKFIIVTKILRDKSSLDLVDFKNQLSLIVFDDKLKNVSCNADMHNDYSMSYINEMEYSMFTTLSDRYLFIVNEYYLTEMENDIYSKETRLFNKLIVDFCGIIESFIKLAKGSLNSDYYEELCYNLLLFLDMLVFPLSAYVDFINLNGYSNFCYNNDKQDESFYINYTNCIYSINKDIKMLIQNNLLSENIIKFIEKYCQLAFCLVDDDAVEGFEYSLFIDLTFCCLLEREFVNDCSLPLDVLKYYEFN